MKNLLLLTIITSFAVSGFFIETDTKAEEKAQENARLCGIFTQKVESYKATLREDSLAEASLLSYEARRDKFCGATESVKKSQEEIVVPKSTKTSLESTKKYQDHRLCTLFTNKTEAYEESMRDDAFAKATLNSYKTRTQAFCGKTIKAS